MSCSVSAVQTEDSPHAIFSASPDDSVGAALIQAFTAFANVVGADIESCLAWLRESISKRDANHAPIRKSVLIKQPTLRKSIDRAAMLDDLIVRCRLRRWKVDGQRLFEVMRCWSDDELADFALSLERMAWHAASPGGRTLTDPAAWILARLRKREIYPAPKGFVSDAEKAAAKAQAELDRQRAARDALDCAERARQIEAERRAFDAAFSQWKTAQTPTELDERLGSSFIRDPDSPAGLATLREAYAVSVNRTNPYDEEMPVSRGAGIADAASGLISRAGEWCRTIAVRALVPQ